MRSIYIYLQKEISQLEDIKAEVDSLRYSSRAASLLDMEDLTDQVATLSVSKRKVSTGLFTVQLCMP